MAAAIGSAMEVTLFGGSIEFFAARSARNIAGAWRERRKNRIEVLNYRRFAAAHHAVSPFQTPNAATGSDVNIMNAFFGQLLCAAQVVDVIGIAAVNQDVPFIEEWHEFGDSLIHHRCRDHQPK